MKDDIRYGSVSFISAENFSKSRLGIWAHGSRA